LNENKDFTALFDKKYNQFFPKEDNLNSANNKMLDINSVKD
jgi:hypothetical protein